MAIIVSKVGLSVAANSFSADQVTGQYQFSQKGLYRLYAKASATGLNVKYSQNGLSPMDNQAVTAFGASGTLSRNDNLQFEQVLNGGKNELVFFNTTAGALTVDFILEFIPTK